MTPYPKLFFFLFTGWVSLSAGAQLPASQQQALILKRVIEKNHYSPRAVNDSFSASVFNSFIRVLDSHQDIFTNPEYQALAAFKYSLDDELNRKSWAFLDLVIKTYRRALQRTDSITSDILQKPLDFKPDEKITFTRDKAFLFPGDAAAQKSKWIKWFKFILLTSAYSMASSDSSKPALQTVLTKNESLIREKIRKGQARAFDELKDPAEFENNVREMYFNAIATAFDPHTNFLSAREKEDFQSDLSTMEYSFGFFVDETDDGKIIIAMLIPGGPAWKSGEIHKQDEVLHLQWKGKAPVEVSTITIDEVEELLALSNHDELTIKVKKQNGTIRTVTLRKEKIETEEEVVRGYLLSGEKKIGYISLPDFYTSWEDEEGSGCANDMAKEIIKMKKESLDGLILDLRYNGGGSMHEALQLCGIFIDEGPLVGVKSKDGKLSFGKDPNRGTIYDGPLLVLVNNQSASASELVAATLQDYHRAVIVGSPTYGKATMQQVMAMDSNAIAKTSSPIGFVKVTTGKLYRVNGQTAQSIGVIPDIILPDAFDGLEYSEQFQPNALPADTVKRNSYYKLLNPLPVASLINSSRERVVKDPSFSLLTSMISKRKAEKISGKRVIPLQPVAFEQWQKENEAIDRGLDEEEGSASTVFKAGNYQLEKERLQHNVYAAELNAAALESIGQDIYVQEAFLVLTDMIKLLKK